MFRVFFFLFLAAISLFAQPVKPTDAFKVEVSEVPNLGINFNFKLHDEIFLYENEFKILAPNGVKLNEMLNLPQSIERKDYRIYKDSFNVFVPFGLILNSSSLDEFSLVAEFTGCSYDGFCYQPQILNYNFKKTDSNYTITRLGIKPKPASLVVSSPSDSQHSQIATSLKSDGFLVTLITFFGYGLLLSLTPCVFPMIPILSSIIVAKKSQDGTDKTGFLISLVYVFAMSLAYALAGVGASFFGVSLQGILQKPALIVAFALVFVALALSMFGFFEIKIPQKIQSFLSKKSENKGGMSGVFAMGFLSALIVGPCVAAPLAGALLYIAQTGNALLGGAALFVMSFGMGIPLLILGAGSAKLLPKPGAWMQEVQSIFGFLLLFMAVWMLSRIINDSWALLLYGAIGIIFAFFLGVFDSTVHKIRRGIAFFILVYGVLLVVGFASGAQDIFRPLENIAPKAVQNLAQSEGINFKKVSMISELDELVKSSKKPVMVDFWASWCASCKELDNITFKDERVVAKLSEFELVKIDVTKNSPDDIALLAKFSIFGPPALIFYKDGKELKDSQIVGFISADKFLEKISRL